ncbi:MAG: glycosyltransferase family 2 protein [Nitrospinae bacterium]|nr:glycosyltransferase family 2 protein [Nitrospinota bacterium]
MKNNTLIIIPAYNEENTIGNVIKGIRNVAQTSDIVVINDGSSDRTESAAKDAGAFVVNLPFNLGYGAALQTGFKYAVRHDYKYAIQMDGDGQHSPSSLKSLTTEIEKNNTDVVIGSRFLGDNNYNAPALRKIGMKIFSIITNFITGQKFTDPTSGYRAINNDILKFYSNDIYPVDYPDADVIIMLHQAGFRIMEIPVDMNPSLTGKSMHSGLKPIYYLFKMMLSIFVTILREPIREKV